MGFFKSQIEKDIDAAQSNLDGFKKQTASINPFTTPNRDYSITYPYDYFSGSDCKIFLGDVWVDDIITIQFTTSQSKMPVYNFASQNFNAMNKGQIIVEGSFAISFKETGYLNTIEALLQNQRTKATDAQNQAISRKIQNEINDSKRFVPGLNDENAEVELRYNAVGSPQIIRKGQTIEQILNEKNSSITDSLSNQMTGSTSLQDFEDFSETLEDTIWGDANGKPLGLNNILKRADEFDYKNGGISVGKNGYSNSLNILLTFGELSDQRAEHTILSINDIHFISTAMIVSPTGDPIAEVYQFIARDINKSINSNSQVKINKVKFETGISNTEISRLEDIKKLEDILAQNSSLITTNFKVIAKLVGTTWRKEGIDLPIRTSINKTTPPLDQLINLTESCINNLEVLLGDYEQIGGYQYVDVQTTGKKSDFTGQKDFTGSKIESDSSKFLSPEVISRLTEASQIIVEVTFADSSKANAIRMILENRLPGTRNFRVISPVRTGFEDTILFSRTDLFTNFPVPDVQDTKKPSLEVVDIVPPEDPEIFSV